MSLKIIRTLLICTSVQIGSVFFGLSAKAQMQTGQPRTTSEVGIGVGGVAYKGEVAPRYQLQNNRPALMLFYKKDVSSAVAWRGSLLIGRTQAEDDTEKNSSLAKDLPLEIYRKAKVTTSLLELSGGIDYKFLDYYDFRRNTRWTPYFTLSVAAVVYNNRTTAEDPEIIYPANSGKDESYRTGFAFAVPIGAGVKYALSEHWNIGAEAGVRVLFTDDFDNLSSQNEQVMNKNSRDLYFFNGVTLSYTFYKINCPVTPSGKK
ncbi:DUF3575 domain-containing protein [Rufibacter immobilis]|uniref:DUF3575 domain-containing protein n=1 Tax=Rufibacter immobilis TaxID=1348778 RepID=A0A3M9MXF9_9BACT|nr:DUF6089 family protein [Rufibacter immobilis]RNI30224.1 DUF3575 domain-containing protein [Rufibacter immobilis]